VRWSFISTMVAMLSMVSSAAHAQKAVTYGRWADNPGGCADPQHTGVLNFDSFVFNKLVCRTKGTQTFYGGEERAMFCDVGETKDNAAVMTFVRTSDTTLQVEMDILVPTAPISGSVALFACPER
jgi:hypothetical protein